MLRWATRVGVTRLLISRPRACSGALRTASHVGKRALACALLLAASSPHSASLLFHAVQASNLDRPGPPPAPGFLALRPRSGVPARTAARRRPRSALNLSSASRGWGCGRPPVSAEAPSRYSRLVASQPSASPSRALWAVARNCGRRSGRGPAASQCQSCHGPPPLPPLSAASPSVARRGHCGPSSCLLAGL